MSNGNNSKFCCCDLIDDVVWEPARDVSATNLSKCISNRNDLYRTTLDVGNSAFGFDGPCFLDLGVSVKMVEIVPLANRQAIVTPISSLSYRINAVGCAARHNTPSPRKPVNQPAAERQ